MLRTMPATALAAGLLFAAASPATAQQPEDCAIIANRYERLDCYDGFFVTDETEMTVVSDWTVQQRNSDFGGVRTIFMWVEAKDPMTCGDSPAPNMTRLYLRCRGGETSMYFHSDCRLEDAHGQGRIDMRVDGGKPFSAYFGESSDNTSLGLWNSERSVPIITRLMGGERLFARIKPSNGSPNTAQFNIGGLATASKPLRQSCGW